MKLTLLYTLIRQLCERAIKSMAATQSQPAVTPKLTDMMRLFSTVPAWVGLIKRSTCRIGVMRGLELAKSSHPDMKPELMVDGFPELNVDGSQFSDLDYAKI